MISYFSFVLWLTDITAAGLLGYLAAITLRAALLNVMRIWHACSYFHCALSLSLPNMEFSVIYETRFPAKHGIFRYLWDNASLPNMEFSGLRHSRCYMLRGAITHLLNESRMCRCLRSEMSIQEVVKDCASFGSADGSDLLHLCFDHCTEYDPDVVFDKNAFFLAFCSKCCFFYETYLHSSVD